MAANHPRLPGTINAIAGAIGVGGASKLADTFGGTAISVPKAMPENHRLVEILGFDTARKMAARFGGEMLAIPRCTSFALALRDDQIRQHRAAGAPIRELCRKFELSARQINNICSNQAK